MSQYAANLKCSPKDLLSERAAPKMTGLCLFLFFNWYSFEKNVRQHGTSVFHNVFQLKLLDVAPPLLTTGGGAHTCIDKEPAGATPNYFAIILLIVFVR